MAQSKSGKTLSGILKSILQSIAGHHGIYYRTGTSPGAGLVIDYRPYIMELIFVQPR